MPKITKNVMGIDVTLDPRILEDWDVLNDLMSLIVDEDDSEITPQRSKEMMVGINRLIGSLYGDDFAKIKNDLRKANGGFLTITIISEFINSTFDAFSKNS